MPSPTQSLSSAPWYFRLAKGMTRRNVPGSWRLLEGLRSKGLLNRPAFYQLSDSVGIEVPIARVSNCWDQADLDGYDEELFKNLALLSKRFSPPIVVIDGGADIGLFSLKFASCCPAIQRIIAFEPNGEACPWLKRNLDRLPFPAASWNKALSNFEGRGVLRFPDYDAASEHARYLEQSSDGPIDVTTVDSLDLPAASNLILKLDVEGAELPALQGAKNTLARVTGALVVMEAHPAVVRRTGIDPLECLKFLSSLRTFRFLVGEDNRALSPDRPVFAQLAQDKVHTIIAETIA